VVYRLPDVYESSTLIVVRPSTLPKSVVTSDTEDNLTRQLASIAQVVQSRSSLEPLIVKYDLYKAERLRGESTEGIIELMRKDVNVKVNTTRNDITNGFNISYRYRDARVAQAITAELAGKYTFVQTQNQQSSGIAAKNFIDNQVAQAREALSAVDKQMLDFKNSKLGTLPTEVQPMLNQLTGLREEQKALIAEIGRLQDSRASAINQVAILKKAYQTSIEDASENLTDPKTTVGYSQLVSRKAQLQGELTTLTQQYTKIHPDVIAKQKELDQVQEEMDKIDADWKDRIKKKQERLSQHPDLSAASVQQQIEMADSEIKRQQKALADNENAIAALVDRINKVPGVDVELSAIDRDYQTKKAAYDDLLQQQQKIGLNTAAITDQQGEGIEVIDAANLPTKPVAPKRLMLSGLGLGAGLGLGLLLVGLFEGPRLLTIQSSEDARHYTGLPVLLSVPELLTPQEARAVPRRRRLLLAAGVVATLVSIPMLALALKLTHVFDLLMQSSGRS
jgi:polysaccharide chain length determinant protein (PEP-CTERM system associated)